MVIYQLHLRLHQNSLYLLCVCQYSVHNNLCIFYVDGSFLYSSPLFFLNTHQAHLCSNLGFL